MFHAPRRQSGNHYVTDIYCADVTESLPGELAREKFDFVVLGEILEHVNNPVLFLEQLKKNLQNNADMIIITVPYCFGVRQMFSGLNQVERNNSDHRYWFSPYTLAKVCFESGLYPEELFFTGNPPRLLKVLGKLKERLRLKPLRLFSTLANTLTIVCHVTKPDRA